MHISMMLNQEKAGISLRNLNSKQIRHFWDTISISPGWFHRFEACFNILSIQESSEMKNLDSVAATASILHLQRALQRGKETSLSKFSNF